MVYHKPTQEALPAATLKRRGQALAEFALTLPILLLLVFGIIEFARIFQAWVVLQSAARAAARVASIGAINYEIFVTEPNEEPLDQRVLNAIVPCLTGDFRGNRFTDTPTGVQYYDGGQERLFATIYDGMDCDPSNEDHEQLRKDILRVFTVMHEARVASGTIAVFNDTLPINHYSVDAESAFGFFKGSWSRPYDPAGDFSSPGWFDIEVCSSRPYLDPESDPAASNFAGSRFVTIRNNADQVAAVGAPIHGYPVPFCLLNEIPENEVNGVPRPDILRNPGHRWYDVGGPGDRVTVFLKFNHPLITPLNLASYIFLESRRSSVNESFRAPKAVGAFQRSLPPGRDEDRPPTSTPSDPTDTPTPTETPVNTATYTPTPTNTPDPFDCDRVRAIWSDPPFSGNQLFLTIQNENLEAIELSRVRLIWNDKSSWPLMYAGAFSLSGTVHWTGGPPASPPQNLVDTRTDGVFDEGAYRIIPGRSGSGAAGSAVWAAMFLNGPAQLSSSFNLLDFEAEFEFAGPNGNICFIDLTRPVIPPTDEPPSPTAGPSPTRTPDCASAQDISLIFSGFDSFDGSVAYTIRNNSAQNTYILGFEFVWPDPTFPDPIINANPGDYFLRQVVLGGSSPDDPLGTRVWQSSGPGQDAVGTTTYTNGTPSSVWPRGTVSTNAAEGTWLVNGLIRPGDTTLWMDFDGFVGSLSTRFGVRNYHLYLLAYVSCSFPGGPGGGGSVPTGVVDLPIPSPTQTNTRRPTNPPQPTLTPSNTDTQGPTSTRTLTRTPSKTPTASNTPAVPTRTLPGSTPTQGGGGE